MKHAVAVSGASGGVGINIVRGLLKAGYDVHTLVHSPLPADHPLAHENATRTSIDLATLPEHAILRWLDEVQPSAFIHAAALADVSACERQPSLAYLMNAHVTRMLARACARSQVHFIMLSTEHVFGGTAHPTILYREEDPVHPLNCYGRSKVQGEEATQEECTERTLWTICRISVVYGLARASKIWYRPDFTAWVRAGLQKHETLRVVVDQINSPLYAGDLTSMIREIVRQEVRGIYHIAGSIPVSRYDFARQIARAYGLNDALIQPARTSELNLSPRRPLNAGFCVDKICRDVGIRPLSPAEGLASDQANAL